MITPNVQTNSDIKLQDSKQQSLQGIGVSTSNGLMDVYVVQVENEPDWILPKKIIVANLEVPSNTHFVNYEGEDVPVLNLLVNNIDQAHALVIEADEVNKRLALLVTSAPIAQQIRISSLRDYEDESLKTLPYNYQTVLLDGVIKQVPNLEKIEQYVFG